MRRWRRGGGSDDAEPERFQMDYGPLVQQYFHDGGYEWGACESQRAYWDTEWKYTGKQSLSSIEFLIGNSLRHCLQTTVLDKKTRR